MSPNVVVILLNYNNHGETIECISSLSNCTYSNLKILVIDNGSERSSVEMIKKAHSHVEVLEIGRNLGFAGGNNVGIRHAQLKNPTYILLLNNDTIVEPDFLEHLVRALESDDSIAIVGGMICYHPKTDIIWYGGGEFVFWRVAAVHNSQDQPATNQPGSGPRDVSFVTGCMMLIRSAVLPETGLLDEKFFMYCEDVEFSHRVMLKGYRLRYVPQARIYHKIHHGGETPFTVYYGVRSRFYLIDSCLRSWRKSVGRLYLTAVTGAKLFFWRKKRPELFRAASAGWRDYRKGITTAATSISLRYPELPEDRSPAGQELNA